MKKEVLLALSALVLLIGGGLRVWAITWGFPLKFAHIDESVVLFYSLRIVSGALNPGFYDYPGFFLTLLAGLLRVLQAVGHGLGVLPSLETLFDNYMAGDSRLFLATARGLTVVFALSTLALMIHMGRRRGEPWVGLGAAALLAVNPLHVLHSHYGTVDVGTAFLTLLAIDRLSLFSVSLRTRDAIAAGAAIGFATAMKYYPGILMVPLGGILFYRRPPERWKILGQMSLAALGAFALGSPSTLLAFPEFASRFQHLFPKIVGTPGGTFPFVSTVPLLFTGLGGLSFLLALVGGAWALREKGYWSAVTAGVLFLFLFIGSWRGQAAHYGLGLYPPLFLLACRGMARLGTRHRKWAGVLWSAAFVLALFPTVRELRYIGSEDARLTAGRWVREHIPPGRKILRLAHTPEFSPRDPYPVKVDFVNQIVAGLAPGKEISPEIQNYDCLIYSSFHPQQDPVLEGLKSQLPLLHSVEDRPPRFPHHPAVFVFQTKK